MMLAERGDLSSRFFSSVGNGRATAVLLGTYTLVHGGDMTKLLASLTQTESLA